MASFPTAIKSFSVVVNGVTKLVAALFNSPNDEIEAIETQLGVNMAGVRLGAWVDKSASYAAQQAATDGFVLVIQQVANGGDEFSIFTDGSNPPTTIRQKIYSVANADCQSTMCPVKKSDYWKVVRGGFLAGAFTVYWIPLGT